MKKHIFSVITFCIAVAALVVSYSNNKSSDVVFIDTGKIYNGFRLSQELNKELTTTLKKKKDHLDSLYDRVRTVTMDLKFKKKPQGRRAFGACPPRGRIHVEAAAIRQRERRIDCGMQ